MPSCFLEKTAQHLVSNYGKDLSEVCVILPNRRAGLFLRKFLAALLTKPVWSPVVFSIEDFMSSLSGLQEVEPVYLLVDLYSIHRDIDKEKVLPFDEFLKWGPQLLADFNEIDRYLADAGDLFSYLDEVRAINLWNLDKSPLTEFQLNYLKFYHSLSTYYSLLTKRLIERGQGYQGLVFRHAVNRVEKGAASLLWKKFVFTGFNALTTAEQKIMEYIHKAGKADFLWDADHYYLDSPFQEAGSHLRQWFAKGWPDEKKWISDNFREDEKSIEVIGVPDVTGQVKLCGELLTQMGEGLDEHTAIILPDETLLIPLLNSLPESVDSLNVTMGLPLNQTPLAGFLDLVFQMHLHTSDMRALKPDTNRFYYRDVLKILQHPFLIRIAGSAITDDPHVLQNMINRIRTGSKVFLRKEDLFNFDLFSAGFNFLDPFFEPWQEPGNATRDLRKIVELIRNLEPEHAFVFARILHQLNHIVSTYPAYFTWQACYQFYRQLVGSSTLPFFGEPLKGLQVMGMLETRTLDFDQVIILSCNEGILPAGKKPHSFIPFDIKHEFGLPTHHHQDAIYAYHFYRLLQRAQKVWLLYNTEPDLLGGGEKSRFIHQLIWELPSWNPGIKIHERFLNSPLPKGVTFPSITITKDGDIPDKLLKKAKDGFSPTALNAYRKCPLRFYFSEIAGLREPEEVDDTIDPKTLGNAVHEALHHLYQSFKGIPLTSRNIKSMVDQTDKAVENAFKEKYKGSIIAFGKNLLLVNVAKIMIRNFLKTEAESLEELEEKGKTLTVTMLEHVFRGRLSIPFHGKLMDVWIKGIVDRVDHIDEERWVIDYKTGLSEKKELRVKAWNNLLHDPLLDKGFQLLCYVWLFPSKGKDVITRAGIASLNKPGNGFMTVQIPAKENGSYSAEGKSRNGQPDTNKVTDKITITDIKEFETILSDLLTGIYDVNTPFLQTEDPEICRRCPYNVLCQR